MTPHPLAAHLTALEAELEQGTHNWDTMSLVYDIVATMTDEGIAALEGSLVQLAEEHWQEWDHRRRCYAFEEYWKVHTSLHKRLIAANEAAGRDRLEGLPRSIPSEKTWIGYAMRNQRQYMFPNVLRLSADVIELRGRIEGAERRGGG